MDHLAVAVPELDGAGDVAAGADREDLLHPAAWGVEEDQRDVARLVLDQHLVGRLDAARRGRAVGRDGDGHRHRIADRRLGDRALQLARDPAFGQVEQEVDDARRAGPPRRAGGRAAARPSGRLRAARRPARTADRGGTDAGTSSVGRGRRQPPGWRRRPGWLYSLDRLWPRRRHGPSLDLRSIPS